MFFQTVVVSALLLPFLSQLQPDQESLKSIRVRVSGSCISRDGKLFVGNHRSTIRIWNTSDLKELNAVKTGVFSSRYVDCSSNGNLVVLAGVIGNVVEVWDISNKMTPRLRAKLDPKSPIVYGVAISPNGRYIAIAERRMQLWDLEKKKKICEFDKEGQTCGYCRFSPNGEILASSTSLEGEVTLWSIEKKAEIAKIDLRFGRARWFEFDAKTELLYIGQEGIKPFPNKGGGIGLYNIKSQKVIKKYQMSVQGMSLSTNGKLLAASEPGKEHSVLFLNAKTLTPVHRIRNVGFDPKDVHFADNDRKLIVRAIDTLEVIELTRVWRLLHKL